MDLDKIKLKREVAAAELQVRGSAAILAAQVLRSEPMVTLKRQAERLERALTAYYDAEARRTAHKLERIKS